MERPSKTLLVNLALIATVSLPLAGCKTIKHTFDPPLAAENAVMKLEVDRVRFKERGARGNDFLVWSSISNKTNETLTFVKNNYQVTVDGKNFKGYVGHSFRFNRGFTVNPNLTKSVSFLFNGLPSDAASAVMTLKNFRAGDSDETHEISIELPVRPKGKTN